MHRLFGIVGYQAFIIINMHIGYIIYSLAGLVKSIDIINFLLSTFLFSCWLIIGTGSVKSLFFSLEIFVQFLRPYLMESIFYLELKMFNLVLVSIVDY